MIRLNRKLTRQIEARGRPYRLRLDPAGLELAGKRSRKGGIRLAWEDLVSGRIEILVDGRPVAMRG